MQPVWKTAWALALSMVASACTLEADRVYSLPLPHAPSEADWAGAVPLLVQALGGRTSRAGEGDVDKDTVHKATASCHHGTQGSPVNVTIRSFYTPERLYLRLEWVDPTPQSGTGWSWNGSRWVGSGFLEDGVGLLWGRAAAGFSCTRACHLEDWRMAGPRAFADYRMASPRGEGPLDFWVWKAGRGSAAGVVEDGRLGSDGREGDTPGDFFAANSARVRAGQGEGFGPGDRPWEAPDPEPGARAPGFLVADPSPGRNEVTAQAARGRGTWVLSLSRSLRGEDPEDVLFEPGGETAFGLAILDGVEKDHTAVPSPIRLVLVKPSALPGRR